MKTHYETLQVTEDASIDVIKGAYRYLIQRWHPDKNLDKVRLAEKMCMDINEAYAVLSSPEKRKQYDELLSSFRNEKNKSADGNNNENEFVRKPEKDDYDEFERNVEEKTREFFKRSEKSMQEWGDKSSSFARGVYRGLKSHAENERENGGVNYKAVAAIIIFVIFMIVAGFFQETGGF